MLNLTTKITRRQREILVLLGLDSQEGVDLESIKGGYYRITWPAALTPSLFWAVGKKVPRHHAMAKPYNGLQVRLFSALRAARARGFA